MKKRILIIAASIAIVLGMAGCTTTSNLNALTDSAVLHSANFEIVRTVQASASATYVIGFIGGSPEQSAIDKLKASADLQPNQALTNYSVTTSTRFIVFGTVIVKTSTATADVVQFK